MASASMTATASVPQPVQNAVPAAVAPPLKKQRATGTPYRSNAPGTRKPDHNNSNNNNKEVSSAESTNGSSRNMDNLVSDAIARRRAELQKLQARASKGSNGTGNGTGSTAMGSFQKFGRPALNNHHLINLARSHISKINSQRIPPREAEPNAASNGARNEKRSNGNAVSFSSRADDTNTSRTGAPTHPGSNSHPQPVDTPPSNPTFVLPAVNDMSFAAGTPVRPRQLDLKSTVKKAPHLSPHIPNGASHEASTPMTANRRSISETPPDTVLKRANQALGASVPAVPPLMPEVEQLSAKESKFRTMMDYASEAPEANAILLQNTSGERPPVKPTSAALKLLSDLAQSKKDNVKAYQQVTRLASEAAERFETRMFDDDDEEDDDDASHHSSASANLLGGMVSPMKPSRLSGPGRGGISCQPSPITEDEEEHHRAAIRQALQMTGRQFQGPCGVYTVAYDPTDEESFATSLVQSTSPDFDTKRAAVVTIEHLLHIEAVIKADKSKLSISRTADEIHLTHEPSQQGYVLRPQDTNREAAIARILGNVMYIDAFGMEQEYPLSNVYLEAMTVQHSFVTSIVSTAWALEQSQHSFEPHRSNEGTLQGGRRQEEPRGTGQHDVQPQQEQKKPPPSSERNLPEGPSELKEPLPRKPTENVPVPTLAENEPRAKSSDAQSKKNPKKQTEEPVQEPNGMDTSSALAVLLAMMLSFALRAFLCVAVKAPFFLCRVFIKIAVICAISVTLWLWFVDEDLLLTIPGFKMTHVIFSIPTLRKVLEPLRNAA